MYPPARTRSVRGNEGPMDSLSQSLLVHRLTGTRWTRWISFPSRASRPRSRRPWSLRDYKWTGMGDSFEECVSSIVDACAKVLEGSRSGRCRLAERRSLVRDGLRRCPCVHVKELDRLDADAALQGLQRGAGGALKVWLWPSTAPGARNVGAPLTRADKKWHGANASWRLRPQAQVK